MAIYPAVTRQRYAFLGLLGQRGHKQFTVKGSIGEFGDWFAGRADGAVLT